MTARHVVEAKGACAYRVILEGKAYEGSRIIRWYTTGTRDLEAAYVATIKLDRRAPGRAASASTTSGRSATGR